MKEQRNGGMNGRCPPRCIRSSLPREGESMKVRGSDLAKTSGDQIIPHPPPLPLEERGDYAAVSVERVTHNPALLL
jgi:hypothetical protein